MENLSWKLQVKPTVGNVSLFPLSFPFFNSLFLSFICLSLLGSQVLARPVCVQVSWTAGQTSLTNLSHSISHLPSMFSLSPCLTFVFVFLSTADVFAPPLPIKELAVLD